jgi:hypothetical protein
MIEDLSIENFRRLIPVRDHDNLGLTPPNLT